jgi:hypothetical protein
MLTNTLNCSNFELRAKARVHDRRRNTARISSELNVILNTRHRPYARWMKRTLVSYDESSTSESEGEVTPLPKKSPKPSSSSPQPAPTGATPQRKRKLPALAAHLAPPVPPDDPSKHQGRTRTTPHVEGQWAAYVYVPIALRGTALRRVVERAVGIAKKGGDLDPAGTRGGVVVPVHTHAHALGGRSDSVRDSGDGAACEELHVSLTRPFFLRAYQREEMKRAVRDVAKAHPP